MASASAAPRAKSGVGRELRVPPAACSWPARRGCKPGRRTSGASRHRSRRRRGGRSGTGTRRARLGAAAACRVELRRELRHRPARAAARCRLVLTDPRGQRPQRQVHFGRDVVRQAAQHRLEAARRDVAAQQLAGRAEHRETGRGRRHRARRRQDLVAEHPLDEVEPFAGVAVAAARGGARVPRRSARPARAPPPAAPVPARSRSAPRYWSATRQHAAREKQPGPPRHREPRVLEQFAEHGRGARLHDVENARHHLRARRARGGRPMSMNNRCPASAKAGGPASGSSTRIPRRRAAAEPITRNAARPIGVIGRYSP